MRASSVSQATRSASNSMRDQAGTRAPRSCPGNPSAPLSRAMAAKVSKPSSRKRCSEPRPAATAGPRIILSIMRRPGVRVSRAIFRPMPRTTVQLAFAIRSPADLAPGATRSAAASVRPSPSRQPGDRHCLVQLLGQGVQFRQADGSVRDLSGEQAFRWRPRCARIARRARHSPCRCRAHPGKSASPRHRGRLPAGPRRCPRTAATGRA